MKQKQQKRMKIVLLVLFGVLCIALVFLFLQAPKGPDSVSTKLEVTQKEMAPEEIEKKLDELKAPEGEGYEEMAPEEIEKKLDELKAPEGEEIPPLTPEEIQKKLDSLK